MTGDVRFDGVWKAYPRWPAGGRTLRSVVVRRVPLAARRAEQRWALRDVSFAVERGRCAGIIGGNGAGKSTLLRLAAGLGRPTRGGVAVHPGSAAVLSLGDTLAPALTGRENALTAAMVAGWRLDRARALVPAALEFSELGEFADAPVRTYSEGMKLRLAFGVVAQLQPSVLVVDEVISVGDLAFQAKCMTRIAELRAAGTTVVLARHDLHQVAHECDEGLWLDAGRVAARGPAGEVVAAYESAARERVRAATPVTPPAADEAGGLRLGHDRVGTQEVTIERVVLRGPDGAPADTLRSGDPLTVSLELRARGGARVRDPIVSVAIHRAADDVLCARVDTRAAGVRVGSVGDLMQVEARFERLDLLGGRHLVDVAAYRSDWDVTYDFHWHAYAFDVAGRGADNGVLDPPCRWSVDGLAQAGSQAGGTGRGGV